MKTKLLGTGAGLFLIGIIGLTSPIMISTLAGIMKKDILGFEFLFAIMMIVGGVLFYLGIRFKKRPRKT